jgi:cyanophycinase
MNSRFWFKSIIFIALFSGLTGERVTGQKFSNGSLVIAGGGVEDNNKSIYNQLIELAGGAEKASFAVIPTASGEPVQSYAEIRKILIGYGVIPGNIYLIRVAMIDDDSTGDADESTWHLNGNDSEMAGLVKKCTGVWFPGGDQMRTVKTLFNADKSKSMVLEAVWEVFRAGGVIGGTSAGAAIMSEIMIGGGNSLSALSHGVITEYNKDDFPESAGLLLTNGLGFFPFGIIDQHFDPRGRIGRLAIALMHNKDHLTLGFGIDENTAIIYKGSDNTFTVAGKGGITIVNVVSAIYQERGNLPSFENIIVSRLEENDLYDIETAEIRPDPLKKPTRGNEYYNNENPGQAGVLTGYSSGFGELLTFNLMDNRGANEIQNLSLTGDNQGFMVTLIKLPESEGFFTDKPDGMDHYTVINVRMDITPVHVVISPIE